MSPIFGVGINFSPETLSFINDGLSYGFSPLSNTEMVALERLVRLLKYYGLYGKFKALYPFIGASVDWHSLNLIDRCFYNISWAGGITHDSYGITGNGSSGYGVVNLHGDDLPLSDLHLSIYNRTDGALFNTNECGCRNASNTIFSDFHANYLGTSYFSLNSAPAGTRIQVSLPSCLGLLLASRTGLTNFSAYRNGVVVGSNNSDAAVSVGHYQFHILSNSNGAEFSPRNLAFWSIGYGLSGAEVFNFNAAVQSYQSALGRAV